MSTLLYCYRMPFSFQTARDRTEPSSYTDEWHMDTQHTRTRHVFEINPLNIIKRLIWK